jgi:hypothetical protein
MNSPHLILDVSFPQLLIAYPLCYMLSSVGFIDQFYWCCALQEEILKAITMLEERVKALEEGSCLDVEILPLYASLPPESQACYYSCLGAFVKLLLLLSGFQQYIPK